MPSNQFRESTPGFRRLYIFGAGGSGREIAWLAEQAWGGRVGLHFIVDNPRYLTEPVNGIPVSLMDTLEGTGDARFVVGLGDPAQRKRIASAFLSAGHRPATLVHPRIEMSRWIEIGAGTVICANCVVTCNVSIGMHVQVNVGCSISHDVSIGDFSTLSPGVNVSGNVRIGRGVFVGTNACFINGHADKPLIIGDGAVIAAGACVTRDVPARSMVAGVPAVIKHER